jgi:hypothetical protein
MIVGFDRDEYGDSQSDFARIYERDPLLDHPVGFQALDTLPAGRGGQADAAADFGHRERGVVLQNGEDFAVYVIHDGRGKKS